MFFRLFSITIRKWVRTNVTGTVRPAGQVRYVGGRTSLFESSSRKPFHAPLVGGCAFASAAAGAILFVAIVYGKEKEMKKVRTVDDIVFENAQPPLTSLQQLF